MASLAVAVVVMSGLTGRADWNQSGAGSYAYTNTAYWSDGAPNGVFPAAMNLNGITQTVTFAADMAIGGGMSIVKTNAPVSTLLFKGTGGDRTLTLGGTLSVRAPDITFNRIGFGDAFAGSRLNIALSTNLTVYSSLGINIGSDSSRGFFFANTVNGAGYGIVKTGPGSLDLYGPNLWTGKLEIREGDVRVCAASPLVGTLATTNIIVRGSGTLQVNNRANCVALNYNVGNYADRIPDAGTVTLRGGNIWLQGTWQNDLAETNGTIVMGPGFSGVRVSRGSDLAPQPNCHLVVSNLSRPDDGATLWVRGCDWLANASQEGRLGVGESTNDSRFYVLNNPPTPVNGIVPWVLIGDPASTKARFGTYGTYGFTTSGIPYVATLAGAAATDNVNLTVAETVSGVATVNSLTTSAGLAGSGRIVLGSGAFLSRAVITVAPKLDFNGQEGILFDQNLQTTLTGGLTNSGSRGITFVSPLSAPNFSWGFFLDAASYYAGPTRVSAGNVIIRVAGGIPTTSPVRVDKGGYLYLWDNDRTIGALSGDGAVKARCWGGVSATISIGNDNGDGIFEGEVRNAELGTLALRKVGNGTQTLSGVNSYTGATTVAGGALLVDGSLASTGVVVNAGCTLGGSGSISGAVAVAGTATLAPGGSGVGTLTLASHLALADGATVACGYDATGSDRIAVGGVLALPTTATVTLTAVDSALPPSQSVLFTAAGTSGTTDLSLWTVNGAGLQD
ncbi:MAG: autotransporter-associated beta strand repeat-containing protein, partial [Kiritimatiellae bacterium]|nr:autotransporter-associated beta strand repeat-containing protein [Kiritimatiellia bacterium]